MAVDEEEAEEASGQVAPAVQLRSTFTERARYIPLRLSMDERRLLRLLEAALSVSEYTDKVDIASWRSKSARIHAQIKDICAILSGLVVAQNYKRGQQLIVDRNFQDNAQFFQVWCMGVVSVVDVSLDKRSWLVHSHLEKCGVSSHTHIRNITTRPTGCV